MNTKSMIWIGVMVGGIVGSYIPTIFGADVLSISSLVFGTIGSLAGIWIGFKVSR